MREAALKILLADDHPLFREGIRPLLLKLGDSVDILEAPNYPTVFEIARVTPDLDLAMLDLFMPGLPGVEGIRQFRTKFATVPVVVFSATEQASHVQGAMDAGASGFITKCSPSEVILNAVKLVLDGGIYLPPSMLNRDSDAPPPLVDTSKLTRRQMDVLNELAHGKSNRQIADNLGLTEGTVKIHLAGIFRILQVTNRTEAVLVAQRMGLSTPTEAGSLGHAS